MDERSLEWLRLVPASSRFDSNALPAALRELLAERLTANPNAYVGWCVSRSELPPAERFDAMVLLKPRGISTADLLALGFRNSLHFSVLPSLSDPRVFAPLENGRVAARALDFITLYRPRARAIRELTSCIARLGRLGWLGDRVVVARRSDSELERWLAENTGLRQVYLAISPGGVSHKRKVTLQVMAADGQVAAFAKVATSPRAIEATERESVWLRQLAAYDQLDGRVPRLMARSRVGEALVTLLSSGPARLAPRTFGQPHWDFLHALTSATRRTRAFGQSTMWVNMQASLQALQPRLSSAWHSRLAATLDRLGILLGQTVLPLSLAHRDFQTGNMRQFRDGRLFVYDWEGAQPESTPLYDLFNFDFLHNSRLKVLRTDVRGYLTQAARNWRFEIDERLLPSLFAAYLVDHTLRRLTNSDLARDALGVSVLDTIAELLDTQASWLAAS